MRDRAVLPHHNRQPARRMLHPRPAVRRPDDPRPRREVLPCKGLPLLASPTISPGKGGDWGAYGVRRLRVGELLADEIPHRGLNVRLLVVDEDVGLAIARVEGVHVVHCLGCLGSRSVASSKFRIVYLCWSLFRESRARLYL